MKKILPILFLKSLIVCFLYLSCQNDNKQTVTQPAPQEVTIESQTIRKSNGTDCEKPDSLVRNCAKINAKYPVVKKGNKELKKAVEDWAANSLVAVLSPQADPDKMIGSPDLNAAVQSFLDFQQTMAKDMPDEPAYYLAHTEDTLLLNDGKHLTIKLFTWAFTGGAHGSSYSFVKTWDAATGKPIALEDIVNDPTALEPIALQKFKIAQAKAFENGFQFDDGAFPFKLADNYGLTDKGIYFCYAPLEVTPYPMGYTEFVIPFDEINSLLK